MLSRDWVLRYTRLLDSGCDGNLSLKITVCQKPLFSCFTENGRVQNDQTDGFFSHQTHKLSTCLLDWKSKLSQKSRKGSIVEPSSTKKSAWLQVFHNCLFSLLATVQERKGSFSSSQCSSRPWLLGRHGGLIYSKELSWRQFHRLRRCFVESTGPDSSSWGNVPCQTCLRTNQEYERMSSRTGTTSMRRCG